MAPNSKTDPILEQLPPERLLDDTQWPLIRAGIVCMHHVETVQQYVAYENQHKQRLRVLRSLAEQAETLREKQR